MRLFIAIDFDRAVKDALAAAVDGLRARARGGNFTRRDNLHLTLAFIGETDRQADLVRVMESVRVPAFDLTLGGLGRFRRPGGDIVFRQVEGGEGLLLLHRQLTQALQEAGFAVERRPFQPHLTLGREVRVAEADLQALSAALPPLRLNVRAMTLMKSERISGVLTYTPLHARALVGQPTEG